MLAVRSFYLILLCSVACWPAQAQSQAAAPAPQSFEVASIKPSAPDGVVISRTQATAGGRFTATGTVKYLIQYAYGVQDFQITGVPGWLASERYDIVAKAETSANADQIKLMLQSLLAERFRLMLHRETRQLPVYALVVGKNGSKLHESSTKDIGPKGPGWSMGRGQLSARMSPISVLTALLSQQLGRTVLDKTGLKGAYDFKLEWTPDEGPRGMGLPADDPKGEPPSVAAPGPSIFTALQEQLGLTLKSEKGPVQVLVVDHVERPTEN